jgi:pimeloyl-ACP methyl ester carboxylesterase
MPKHFFNTKVLLGAGLLALGAPPLDAQVDVYDARLPLPVLFLHGMSGDASSWGEMASLLSNSAGLTEGAELKYCLNGDGSSGSSTLDEVLPFTALPTAHADFFRINFECNSGGTCWSNSSSNSDGIFSGQAAAAKQGLAVADAIAEILDATGAPEIVLVGHSMGGLAAREYLQNPEYWPVDAQGNAHHHVAKLVTSGTPHNGSNFTVGWLEDLGDLFGFDIEQRSDAVRDLRTSYFYSGDPGVYLFGGLEDNWVLWDFLFQNFWNVDVNCDGDEGDNIIGLNQKPLSDDLEFAFITSYDDGIVSSFSSDAMVSMYNPTHRERFFVSGVFHTSMNDELGLTLQGMDEPDDIATAYPITPGQTIMGFTSPQGVDAAFPSEDRDVYAIAVTEESIATLDTLWFGSGLLEASWLDAQGNFLGNALAADGVTLDPGTAHLRITTSPTTVVTNHLFTAALAPAPVPCPADLDQSGLVTANDVLLALSQFGCSDADFPEGCNSDVDGDGIVGVNDILTVLSLFGTNC